MTGTGIVISLTGVVKAIATDGTERVLRVGDGVYVDEQVVTNQAGSVVIEFADGLMMDLGRNAQSILDEEILNLDFDITPKDDALKEQVQATQRALLQDKNFDPTADLEAPAAGPTAVEGAGDDDGFSAVQVEYAEPRMTPVSGFETNGIGVDFTEIIPELILEPQQVQGAGVGTFSPLGQDSTDPSARIFTLNESSEQGEPVLTDGDSSKWLGFEITPSAEDAVTSITITGFPENANPDASDWLITPFTELLGAEEETDYQVNFTDGPLKSSDGTWEITVEVTGALPGEQVAFVIPVIPMGHNANEVVELGIETTVNDGGNTFLTSADVDVLGSSVLIDDVLDSDSGVIFSGSGSDSELVFTDSSSAGSANFLGSASASSSINQMLQQETETASGFDVL